jgi:uncharacterized membrane protein YdbT with pleckstrin-like domain
MEPIMSESPETGETEQAQPQKAQSAEPAASPQPEQQIWRGGPSQIINAGKYALCLVLLVLFLAGGWYAGETWTDGRWPLWTGLALAGLVVVWGLWQWIKTASYSYELTSERLRTSLGVLSRQTHELELYRVQDSMIRQPLWQRLMGLGTIVLYTSDETSPQQELEAVSRPHDLRDQLRHYVEHARQRKRVRTIDFAE